ncbi:unnamed protein product [Notodromas monacha]|uniref:SSD domain-containing protein n=1 Tax=Notodromas monacha TaxID=399045 RepID=A0A7R9BDP4_9CRUS|nr:unnamed protein product [Notodromas monacha]CAG0912885.1 unnamed protein product [Notodromas monacha]
MMSKHDSEHAPESGKPEPNLSRCSRDILPRLLTAALRKLGARVGRHPFWFIAATMVLTLIYGSAIFRNIVYITNIEYLYIPTNAESWHDRAVSEEFFHMNFSGEFQPDRSSRFGSFAHVLVYPKDGGTVLRRESFDEVLRIDAMIRNITIPGPGQKQPALKYADLCARWGNDCFHTDAVKIANVVDDVEAGRVNLTFPVFFDEKAFDYIILPGSIGKPVLDGDVVLSTPAVGMYFILKAGTPDELALGREWEKEFVRQMQAISKTSSMVDVYYESRDTVEHEFDSLKDFVPLQGFLAGLIVCIFSVVCCMMTDWVRAKPMLAVFGVASTVMATITAFGFLMSLGYPATTILCITPFLMLG